MCKQIQINIDVSEKSAAESYSSTLVSVYQYTRCNVPKDGKYCLAVCSISTSYEQLCVFVLQNHTYVKAYRSREVFMDTLLNSKICDESQIVSLYALREKLLLHVISRLGGSQVLCVCGEVEEIQASCRESAIPSRSPSPYTHVIELPTLNFKFPVSNTKIRQFE